ncbi:MAG: PEP-CTERM sorting domain-containing protein [Deltaproteobacteria bacterium]|nr:PEP-CTERM sorting domain-containing protein [Deltaproteobacteria bacterium]MBW2361344.1 PEP-CTERM sorting domain-containing protein [Deltaproteobacteria bacterium]
MFRHHGFVPSLVLLGAFAVSPASVLTRVQLSGPLLAVDPNAGLCDLATGVSVGSSAQPPGEPCSVDLTAQSGVIFPHGDTGIVVFPGEAIPEPSAALLFAVGLVLLQARRRA